MPTDSAMRCPPSPPVMNLSASLLALVIVPSVALRRAALAQVHGADRITNRIRENGFFAGRVMPEFGHDGAVAHHENAIGQREQLQEIGGDEQDTLAALREAINQFVQLEFRADVN